MMRLPDKWFYWQDLAGVTFYISTRNERRPSYEGSPFCVDEYAVNHGFVDNARAPHNMNYTAEEEYIARGGVE